MSATPAETSKTQAVASPSAAAMPDYSHLKGATDGFFHVVKQRWLNIGLTALLIIPGIVAMVLLMLQTPQHAPLKLGIDFTGGALVEYAPQNTLPQEAVSQIRQIFEQNGETGVVVQIKNSPQITESTVKQVLSIRTKPVSDAKLSRIESKLTPLTGTLTRLQKSSIGPSLANELFYKGLLALALAYVLIMAYLTLRFQADFAICAMVALIHDALFVVGAFAVLGLIFGTEIDSLFITGILTVVGFSVHDTIVVFDRIRENLKRTASQKLPFWVVVNMSVNQTLARSINTSLTALLPLTALLFFGGTTTREFVLCMTLGILVGTYSSIAIASMLVCWWRERGEQPA
ncbi:MAG: protein translocase subunit SecF [Vampirovibrionales bacterium]|nr:protein translocase subunit SecF [Vampirovibrionales bacterium]